MTVLIERIRAIGSSELAVEFLISEGAHACRERFVISVAQYADFSPEVLEVGETDRDTYDNVAYASRIHEAWKKGLSLLSYGSCSETALIRKMISRGYDREIVTEAVHMLCKAGYIDNEREACREAERCAGKLWGKKRIIWHLRDKGYPDASIRKALACLKENEVSYAGNCAELIRRKYGTLPETPQEYERMFACLRRYGYSMDEIREACERI